MVRLIEYCSDLWSSMVLADRIGQVQAENGERDFQTSRSVVHTIFNDKDTGQVKISTVEYC